MSWEIIVGVSSTSKIWLLRCNHDVENETRRSTCVRSMADKVPQGGGKLTVNTKPIGGLLIGGTLGEVVQAAHGR